MTAVGPRLLFLVTEDWYFHSHRLGLACAARAAGYEILVGTRCTDHGDIIAAHGMRPCPIPFARALLRPWADWRAWRAIRALIRREQPDVIQLIALKPILLGGLALGARSRIPVVLAFTGLGYIFSSSDSLARGMRPLVALLLRYIARRPATWVLTQNADDAALLRELGVGTPPRSRTIAGAGIDTEAFSPSPEPAGVPPLVLLPARLLRDKGVHEFVAAARRLRARGVAVRCVLVGARDADNPAAVSATQIEAWQREGVIEWWGQRSDMPAVYAQANLVCLPSYREGLPKVLLEAAACARALIASDVPGCREICRHEVSGLLVPARDPQALAAAIARLLDDATLRDRLARQARQLAEQEFALEHIAAATLALYADMRAAAAVREVF